MKLSFNKHIEWLSVLAFSVLGSTSNSSIAGTSGVAYSQISSNGIGLGYAISLTDDWALRGQKNNFSRTFTGSIGDFGPNANLAVDLQLDSIAMLADWYPTESSFRLTGGALINNNQIHYSGTNALLGSSNALKFDGSIQFSESPSPYIGLGYGMRPKKAFGFGFNMDFGLMFQNPKVELNAAGVSAQDIAIQKRKIEDAVGVLKSIPVLGLGISYGF